VRTELLSLPPHAGADHGVPERKGVRVRHSGVLYEQRPAASLWACGGDGSRRERVRVRVRVSQIGAVCVARGSGEDGTKGRPQLQAEKPSASTVDMHATGEPAKHRRHSFPFLYGSPRYSRCGGCMNLPARAEVSCPRRRSAEMMGFFFSEPDRFRAQIQSSDRCHNARASEHVLSHPVVLRSSITITVDCCRSNKS